MSASAQNIKFELDLPVGEEWRNVELFRTSILSCLTMIFQNSDFCESVSMVAGELLENAVKYGDWSAPKSAFRLRVMGVVDRVTIEVANCVAANSPGLQTAIETIQWLNNMPSAAEAYSAKLQQAAAGNGETSGLGLVRIAYEGGCTLSADVDDDNILVVRAVCAP